MCLSSLPCTSARDETVTGWYPICIDRSLIAHIIIFCSIQLKLHGHIVISQTQSNKHDTVGDKQPSKTLYRPQASISAGWKRCTAPRHLLSLAVNRWLSCVADTGPQGANWSDPWPLALMEGVAGGQACKGYPLYPSPWTGAQSWGRHPTRIRGSRGGATTGIAFIWSIWAKEQTPWCSVAPVMLWPKLSIFDFSQG